jgi:hypothetical protein
MPARGPAEICLTTLAVLLASYLSCGSSAQTSPPLPSERETLHRTFQLRVADYLTLRRRLQGARPRTSLTEPIQVTFLSRAALASEIRHARAGAREGDIFSPEITMMFREKIDTALREGLLGGVLAALEEPAHVAAVPVVNGELPEQAIIALPVCLQRVFPPLPPELQYAFLHRDLLLVDVHAGLIVDYVPAAIPSLTE